MMSEADIERVLRQARTIAIVGLSAKEERPSWGVARYLKSQGYRIIPVNPGLAGKVLLGEMVHADLSSIPNREDVDMVDIFRQSSAIPGIVDEALAALPNLYSIWLQLGISHPAAVEKARKAGVTVIENRCPKIELPRLAPMLHPA